MQGTISQRIALEGVQEIIRQLSEMGAAGEKAMRQLELAGMASGSGLGQASQQAGVLGGVLGSLGAELGPLVKNISAMGASVETVGGLIQAFTSHVGGLTAAVGAAAAALLLMGKNAAESTRALENQAATVGMTAEQFEGLRFAFSQAGVSSEAFTRGLDRFAVKLGEAGEAQKRANDEWQQSANKSAQARLEIEKLQFAVTQAGQAVEKSGTAYRESVASFAQSRVAAERTGDAYNKLARTQEGLGLHRTTEQVHRVTEEMTTHEVAVGKVQIAHEKLNQAFEETGNAARRLTMAKEELRLKQQQLENETVKETNIFQRLGITVLDSNGQVRQVLPTFTEFVDKFNELKTPAEQADVALKLFGRSFMEIVPGLRMGSEELRRLSEWFEKSGASATQAEKEYAVAFNAAFAKMDALQEGLRRAVGNIVGQLFVPLFDAISNMLSKNAQNVRDFAAAFTDLLLPVVRGAMVGLNLAFAAFGHLVDGVRRIIQTVFGIEFTNGATAAMLLLARFAPVISGILLAIDLLRRGVNRLFGTEFTTGQAAALALFLRLAPVITTVTISFLSFRSAIAAVSALLATTMGWVRILAFVGMIALSDGISAVTVAIGGMTAALGLARTAFAAVSLIASPWIALGVAVMAVVAAITLVATHSQEVSELIRKYIGADAAEAYDKLASYLEDTWSKLVEALKGYVASWAKYFADKIGEVLHAVDRLIERMEYLATLGFGGRWSEPPAGAAPATGMSGGGRVPGRGVGDVVNAWLEPGEFVMKVQAVRQYGLDFMHRINSMQVPAFNLGGLVGYLPSAHTQHFANGGVVASSGPSSTINLAIDGHLFAGLTAPQDTADNLVSFSRQRQLRSAGRRPGWNGG